LIGSDVHDTSVRFAHVVWLSHTEADTHIPANFQECVLSWEHCTGVQLVVWLNSDCLELLRLYSDNVSFYKTKLKSPVERSDYMRMIILHEFGGFYSDVDVWVQNDFVNHIDVSRPVALVRSPLVTEAFQSCLLVANTRHHPLWLDIVRRIENNVRSVECGSCGRIVYWLLRVPMLGRLVRTMLTVFIRSAEHRSMSCIEMSNLLQRRAGSRRTILQRSHSVSPRSGFMDTVFSCRHCGGCTYRSCQTRYEHGNTKGRKGSKYFFPAMLCFVEAVPCCLTNIPRYPRKTSSERLYHRRFRSPCMRSR